MIVLDNSVLSAFKRLGKLKILKKLFGDIVIPEAVATEFFRKWGRKSLPSWIKVVRLSLEEKFEASKLDLGPGESEAIVLAMKMNCLLAVDDLKARKVARKYGIPIIGSIGILRLAFEMCLIKSRNEYEYLLLKLREDLYLTENLIKWALSAQKCQ